MTWTRPRLLFFTTLLLAPLAARAETLTLEQCVQIALKESPDAAMADLDVEAAIAKKNSARGGYGPRLKLDANVQRWDKEFSAPLFGMMPSYCPTCPWAPAVDASGNPIPRRNPDGSIVTDASGNPENVLKIQTESFVFRPQWTWSLGATVAQPIASLWTVHEANQLARLGIDVAQIKRKAAERDVAYQVTEAYYRVLQAKKLEEVAVKSVEQVTAQVRRAKTFYEQGAVARNDVLRAELGLAAAQQRLIQTRGVVTMARSRLATLMGRSPETNIDTVDNVGEITVSPPAPSEKAEQEGVDQRFELKEVALRVNQATANVRLAKSKMIPQVNAVANYTRSSSSMLSVPKAWFIGATASWDIWEGGSTYYGIDESKAQLALAVEARRKAENMIRLDVRNAHVGVTTAAEAMGVAQHAVEQAEENFRIEQKRYEGTSNTSFDVLDAETQLTTARGQHQAAIYDYVIAQSNLARAKGERHPGVRTAK